MKASEPKSIPTIYGRSNEKCRECGKVKKALFAANATDPAICTQCMMKNIRDPKGGK